MITLSAVAIAQSQYKLNHSSTKVTNTSIMHPKELPIYCVDRKEKIVALSFDAAWGNEDTGKILSILKKMVLEHHTAVLMSLHELDLAQKISDYVICVHGDRIEKYGTPEEIFTSEYIHHLYGITTGSYNASFGCLEMGAPAGKPQVFVIGGNGRGIPVYRKLQRAGIPFIAGVIHSNDLDYDVAKALAAEVISEEPFEAVTEEHLEKAEKMMDDCAEVICCVDKFGTMNAANRRLVEKAKRDGKLKTE